MIKKCLLATEVTSSTSKSKSSESKLQNKKKGDDLRFSQQEYEDNTYYVVSRYYVSGTILCIS